MTDQLEGQMSIFDLDSSFLRTSPDSSVRENQKEQTSRQSSQKSSGSSKQMLPMFLYLSMGSGQKQDASWDTETTDVHFPSLTDYSIHSFGEQPYTMQMEISYNEVHRNGVNASHLSEILVDSAHPRYYLSGKAASGIIRRAEKKGKPLPEILRQALENQMNRGNVSNPKN